VPNQAQLWEVVHASFAWHVNLVTDSTPQDALNRIAAKCITKQPNARASRSFDPSNCTLREEREPPSKK